MNKAVLFGFVLPLLGVSSGWADDPNCDPDNPDALPCNFPSVTAHVYDANALAVYRRPYADRGLFVPLETTYNPATDQIRALMSGFGEFTLGYPDVADMAFAPLLHEPESLHVKDYMTPYPQRVQPGRDYTVNQELPICLSWSPVGLAEACGLQVSSNGALAWEVSLTLAPGDDYAIQVRSMTDETMADASDAMFTIK